MKAKHGLLFGFTVRATVVAVAAAIFAFILAGCDNPSNSSPGSQSGAIPSDLAGSWGYSSDPDSRVFTINSDGSGTYGNNACTWSVSGSTLTLTMTLQGQTMTGSAAYSISSGRLTFSNQSGLLGQYLDPTQVGGSYFEKISGSDPNPDPDPNPGPEKGVYIGLLSFAGSATNLIDYTTEVPNLDYLKEG
ncbi:MAG: hypothetical protein LBG76_05665, partial [Treponema sp.]|nr:hypothetical protein [Treponema sp.]